MSGSIFPPDLDALHAIAIALIFTLWAVYAPLLRLIGRGSLNIQLHTVRVHWMRMLLLTSREHRTFDAVMFGHIMNSISFFGSATLLVLAGLVGTLANISGLYATVREIEFFPSMSIKLFALHLIVLAVILATSFFSFTYAQRKLAYTLALIGGLREAPGDSPECQIMIKNTAVVLTESVKSINNGIRGFYFAVAALFLFVGPWIAITMTIMITAILYYRQKFSVTARAIAAYVDALEQLTHQGGLSPTLPWHHD
jgi:uncharacterized membrane protein